LTALEWHEPYIIIVSPCIPLRTRRRFLNGRLYPVEKFSPPSVTTKSRLRKTLAFTVSGVSAGISPEGMRCTRRSASNCHHTSASGIVWLNNDEQFPHHCTRRKRQALSVMSRSRWLDPLLSVSTTNLSETQRARGMIVNRLRKSVSPMLDISTPSTRIRPLVGSTKRNNDSASVLFPEPVLPRMPT
jgi:hypothetical protein